MIRRILFLLWVPAIFFLDRFTKFLVIRHLAEGQGFPVIQGIFHVTRVNNSGAAFGMMRGSLFFLIAVSLLCILFIMIYLLKTLFSKNPPTSELRFRHVLTNSAWALILAGSLGNLYDRIYYGYVIDFIDWRVWPVFNIADACICVGAALLGYHFLFPRKNKEQN